MKWKASRGQRRKERRASKCLEGVRKPRVPNCEEKKVKEDSNGSIKRVREDNDMERPDVEVIELGSSSEEEENVTKTTGAPVR